MVEEECDGSIPYADEEGSRAVVEGARATLREARPLSSALVDQSTQTVFTAEGETMKSGSRVTFSDEKNGSAAIAAAPADGGSKCAVQ